MNVYKNATFLIVLSPIQYFTLLLIPVFSDELIVFVLTIISLAFVVMLHIQIGKAYVCPRCENSLFVNPKSGFGAFPSRNCRKCNLPLDREVSEEEIRQSY